MVPADLSVTGTVRRFSDEMGEGSFIPDGGGEEIYVCLGGVATGQGGALEVLRPGARGVYERVSGGPVPRAENVRNIDQR
jgi:cold shock CspA family protein